MATKITQIKRGDDILHPETDTSQVVGLADWAKQPTKPTYTASEVGALPSTTEIPSKTSDLTNDSGFITSADIADKADKYVTQSKAETALSLAINATAFPKPTILTYGTLTAFELTEVATITNEVVITFSVGATAISITIPSGTKYVGDLTTKANESYVMSILDGVLIMSNYKSQL